MAYQFYNENPLNRFTDDCVIRSISCATNRNWDEVYDELSNLAQKHGTLFDKKEFVQWYLDSHYKRVPYIPKKVKDVAKIYSNNIILCTVRNHICCIRFGTIIDTFNPSERLVEDAWIVR